LTPSRPREGVAPPETPPEPRALSRRGALALGLAAALAFALLAGLRLTAQGPEYDELHQAAGAFTWLGEPPPDAFCLDFHGVCILNTTYSAALKTNLYGLFLKVSGRGFRLADWRWCGILMIATALALFAPLARRALGAGQLALFYALLLSDGTLLVLGRFDWGPVALAFALRTAMIGLWLSGEAAERLSPRNSLALGALASFAAFEKLSSAVLVFPLAAMLLGSPRRRDRRHLGAALLGLAAGALPLALVNLGWLARAGEPISLRALRGSPNLGALDLGRELLVMGLGGRVRERMLALTTPPLAAATEGALLLAILAWIAWAALRGPREPGLRRAGVALASFLAIGIGLRLLPRATWVHHWILATPFQYLALALALPSLAGSRPARAGGRIGLTLLLASWLALRLAAVVSLTGALGRGAASEAWDPSLAALGRFSARQAPGTLFVATGWGVGTQILCFNDGRPDRMVEPFWESSALSAPRTAEALRRAGTLYLVRLRRSSGDFPATRRIEQEIATGPDWREVPVEAESLGWPAVLLRKFVRRGPSS